MCVYGTEDCNYAFEDGIEIQSYESVDHFVEWNTEEDGVETLDIIIDEESFK